MHHGVCLIKGPGLYFPGPYSEDREELAIHILTEGGIELDPVLNIGR